MAINDPITAPTHVAEWATDGGADKTAPASPSLGHVVGEKTDFNSSTNYILNNLAAWSKFNLELNAADIAYANIIQDSAYDFGASILTAAHMTYDPLAELWYFSTYRAGACELYSSPTGLGGTWSVAVSRTCSADHNMTPLRSNGTLVAVGLDDGFHMSTSNSISDIAVSPTSTFAYIDEVRDCIYDQDSGRWFVIGVNTAQTSSYLESSADGLTWDSELTFGGSILMTSISHDNLGAGVITTDIASVNYHISGGMTGSWSGATTDPSTYLINTAWSPSLELYIGTTTADRLWFSSTGDVWTDTGLSVYAMYVTPEFTLAHEKSTNECLAFVSPALDSVSFTMMRLGMWSIYPSNYWTDDTTWEGGQGKLIFTHGSYDQLAVSVYGPEE